MRPAHTHDLDGTFHEDCWMCDEIIARLPGAQRDKARDAALEGHRLTAANEQKRRDIRVADRPPAQPLVYELPEPPPFAYAAGANHPLGKRHALPVHDDQIGLIAPCGKYTHPAEPPGPFKLDDPDACRQCLRFIRDRQLRGTA
jgi:hypothetical protein